MRRRKKRIRVRWRWYRMSVGRRHMVGVRRRT
jgi:hypothetical protein